MDGRPAVKAGNVPTARVGPILGELISERWPYGGGEEILADKVGCDEAAIRGIVHQRHEGADFDLVDKLFCSLGRPDIWRGQLADVYFSVNLTEPSRTVCPHRVDVPRGKKAVDCCLRCRTKGDKINAQRRRQRRVLAAA